MLLAAIMLIMLIMLDPCFGKMLLSQQMLIMLIMLDPNGDSWERAPWDIYIYIYIITCLSIPLWKAKNAFGRGNVNNVKSLCLKNVPFTGNVDNVDPNGDSWERAQWDLGFNKTDIIIISPVGAKILLAGRC